MDLSEALNRNILFVRDLQKGKFFQSAMELDLSDGFTKEPLFECRDIAADLSNKAARVFGGGVAKSATLNLRITLANTSQQVLRVTRKTASLKLIQNLAVFDEQDALIGELREPNFSLSKTYEVISQEGKPVHVLQVQSAFNCYRIHADKEHVATVHLKWKGVNADYFKAHCKAVIEYEPVVLQASKTLKQLLLAVSICVENLNLY